MHRVAALLVLLGVSAAGAGCVTDPVASVRAECFENVRSVAEGLPIGLLGTTAVALSVVGAPEHLFSRDGLPVELTVWTARGSTRDPNARFDVAFVLPDGVETVPRLDERPARFGANECHHVRTVVRADVAGEYVLRAYAGVVDVEGIAHEHDADALRITGSREGAAVERVAIEPTISLVGAYDPERRDVRLQIASETPTLVRIEVVTQDPDFAITIEGGRVWRAELDPRELAVARVAITRTGPSSESPSVVFLQATFGPEAVPATVEVRIADVVVVTDGLDRARVMASPRTEPYSD